ncbi:MAG: hypothetical protein A2Y12_18495 [Planctomycetes bacterium GWF2_42_9]|nr:MAG: hypothetical protein A2Y12_18495 [Planctomycetes bacterium GWF2_42_9]
MSNIIKCPHCGKDIEVTEVLTHSIRESMKAEVQAELAKKEQAFAQREAELKQRQKELAAQQESIEEQVAVKLKADRQRIAEESLKKAREEIGQEASAMAVQLEAEKAKNRDSQKRELELLRKQTELQAREEALELETARKMAEERKKIFNEAQSKAAQEQELKFREKDDLIKSMQVQMEHMQRKIELGSQEAAGEALEGTLKTKLSQVFAFDIFEDVKKGARGADIVQRIRNSQGKECGKILWEAKNAQNFSREWIEKLKKDQQEAGADIAVLATVTMPKEISGFGLIDDVWVTDYKTSLCLATALRQGILNVAREKMIVTNQESMKDIIYRYITGQEFTLQVKSIVAAFGKMKDDLETEKRFALKNWKSREKQIETVLGSVSNIYGAVEGFVGQKALPQIDPLMLESHEDEGV